GRLADAFDAEWSDRIRILDDDRVDLRHIERRGQDVFGKARCAGAALLELVVLHQALAECLHDTALALAFDALGVDGTADVVRGPDAEHLHFAGDRVDLDLGDLAAEHIGLPRLAGTVDGI